MDHPLRRPEEILAYRPLKQILKSGDVWAVAPADTVLMAVRIMEEKNIGFLVVLEKDAIVGVVSERDCLRRVSKQWAFVVELIRCKRGSERSLQLS